LSKPEVIVILKFKEYSQLGQKKSKCMKFDMGHALCIEKSFMFPSTAGEQCTFWKILACLCTLLQKYVQMSLAFFFTLKRGKKACMVQKK